MSQIGSSSGVRVAAQPLSNVYTVLLLVGALALIVALVMLVVVMNGNYGGVLGEGPMKAVDEVAARQETQRSELEDVDQSLRRFPEGISASQGTAPSPTGAGATPGSGETTTPETEPAAPEPSGAAGTGTDAPAGN